jgi:TetR/AcrR family transcriptional repressor for divergent bdcA
LCNDHYIRWVPHDDLQEKNIVTVKKISSNPGQPAGRARKGAARGRPRAFDEDRAVDTAMTLFHARGYDAVGVAELGEAIGVKAPSLYAAFGSKKGLFERSLARYLEGEGAFIQAVLDEPGPAAKVISRLLLRAAQTYGAPNGLPGCLVLDGTRNCADPEIRALTAELRELGRERVVARIARDFPDQAEALADYVGVTLAGLSAAARDGMAPEALWRTAEIAAAGFRAQLPQGV